MSNLYRGPSTDTSVSVHLAKLFQSRRFLRNQPIRNNNCLWCPCLITNCNEMSNLDVEPSIDALYLVSDQLAMRFQRRRFFRNQQFRNKNCMWRSCLFMDRCKMNSLDRGPSKDASYKARFICACSFRGDFFRNQQIRN